MYAVTHPQKWRKSGAPSAPSACPAGCSSPTPSRLRMRSRPTRSPRPSCKRSTKPRRKGLRSAEVTPFLLARLAELTGAASVRANVALLINNARVAGEIAVALAGVE